MATFGNNLKTLRQVKRITQKEFAEKMQTTQQRVSEWECNKVEPSLYNIMRMLRILDVPFEELTEGIMDN